VSTINIEKRYALFSFVDEIKFLFTQRILSLYSRFLLGFFLRGNNSRLLPFVGLFVSRAAPDRRPGWWREPRRTGEPSTRGAGPERARAGPREEARAEARYAGRNGHALRAEKRCVRLAVCKFFGRSLHPAYQSTTFSLEEVVLLKSKEIIDTALRRTAVVLYPLLLCNVDLTTLLYALDKVPTLQSLHFGVDEIVIGLVMCRPRNVPGNKEYSRSIPLPNGSILYKNKKLFI